MVNFYGPSSFLARKAIELAALRQAREAQATASSTSQDKPGAVEIDPTAPADAVEVEEVPTLPPLAATAARRGLMHPSGERPVTDKPETSA